MPRPSTPTPAPRDPAYLDGQFLVAMPGMADARFSRSVIYVCAHSADGAMGIIVNKPVGPSRESSPLPARFAMRLTLSSVSEVIMLAHRSLTVSDRR